MKYRKCAWVLLICLAGCSSSGPVFNVGEELPEWALLPSAVDPSSDQAPIIDDPVVTFKLPRAGLHSALSTGEDWRIGQSYLFGFDVRAESDKLGSDGVVISRLTRVTLPKDALAEVLLDRQNGITVFGRTCVASENLSDWHRVEMRIRIANNDTGFLEVFCDREPIWSQENLRTTFRPICRLSEECDQDIAKPARFSWQVGLMPDQPVSSPVEIQMQRLHQRVIFYIPNRAGTL